MVSTHRNKLIENGQFKTDLLVNVCVNLLFIRLLLTSVRSCWFMWTSCDQMRSVWKRNWREKGKELKGWHLFIHIILTTVSDGLKLTLCECSVYRYTVKEFIESDWLRAKTLCKNEEIYHNANSSENGAL